MMIAGLLFHQVCYDTQIHRHTDLDTHDETRVLFFTLGGSTDGRYWTSQPPRASVCVCVCVCVYVCHVFTQEHYESAIYHFQQLMERQPTHWRALSQLIDLLRRAGKLDEVPK